MLGRAMVVGPGAQKVGWTVAEITYVGLAAAAVKAMGSILLAFTETRAAGELACALRERLVARVAAHGMSRGAPRILATVAVRLREVETALVQGAIASLRAVAQLAPILVGVIFVSPLLALVGTLVLAPFGFALAALRRRWRSGSEGAQLRAEDLHTGVDELVGNLDLWRTYGATERIAASIRRAGESAVGAATRVEVARAALSGSNEVLGALALVGAVAGANHAGISLGDGTLVAFAAMCFMAYRPLRDLGDARAASIRGSVALDAIEALLASPDAKEDDAPASPSSRQFAAGTLELSAFGARDRGPTTSFVLGPGEVVAVIGPTGCGKTTLLRALLGLEPARGALRHAGVDLTAARVGPDERPFAWVPQDAPLVTGSIIDNVALLCGDADRAHAALSELGATSLLSRGDDVVGPGGRPLSGGERRLVSLARAFASAQPILLLDEPAEGLDADSRARVIDALDRLKGRRAVVVVTHHEEVAAAADRIVPLGTPGSRLAAE
jgi:ABC-type multidrug transport system fused ATPase/permease subunit